MYLTLTVPNVPLAPPPPDEAASRVARLERLADELEAWPQTCPKCGGRGIGCKCLECHTAADIVRDVIEAVG